MAAKRLVYDSARILHRRVQLLTSPPLEELSRLKVAKFTRDIGEDHAANFEKVAGEELKSSTVTDA